MATRRTQSSSDSASHRTPRKVAVPMREAADVESLMRDITKQFGEGSVMRMGDNQIIKAEVISTGSIALDAALGIGGVPRGRVTEIYGAEASGKTTLALHCVAETQKAGGNAAFIDAEHALDPVYARNLGVDMDNLLISQPDTGEQALEIADMYVRSGVIDIVVIDSVAALVPRAELEGEMGDVHMGLQARMMSQALRKLTGNVRKTRTCFVFINQVREKIGVVFGSPITTPGGRALKFAATIRIEVSRTGNIKKEGADATGIKVQAKVVKNKFAPPFRKAEFEIEFGVGISEDGGVLDAALDRGVIVQKGAWFLYGDERLGQGRENVKRFLRENRALMLEIRDASKA
jgi:recombination protein RecA